MKLTRHNGRSGKNGAYNPKHNDRQFHVEKSDHINPARTKFNIYFGCYTGYHGNGFPERDPGNVKGDLRLIRRKQQQGAYLRYSVLIQGLPDPFFKSYFYLSED